MATPRRHADGTDQEAALEEGHADTEDVYGSGHVSGPWDGDELAELAGVTVDEEEE